MGDQQGQGMGIEALKERISGLEARIEELETENAKLKEENEKLREALEKGAEALEKEVEEQKEEAIDTIIEKTKFTKDELQKMKLPALRLILKTIDSAKGTVKGVRSAGAGSEGKGSLTVGDLYHKEE